MRAGTLDRRIALQRLSMSYSTSGEPAGTWSTLVERWANVSPVVGDERNASEQWVAREQTKFTVRWSQELDDLSPLDRIIYPIGDSPQPVRSTYDIIDVLQNGRQKGITILAARRVA